MSGPSLIQQLEQLEQLEKLKKKTKPTLFGIANTIRTGNFNKDDVDGGGNTALMIACSTGLESIALDLIQTGQSKPEHANKFGSTALIMACSKGLESVALELIKTRQSNPEQVNGDGSTALTIACSKSLENVALELIKTGQSKPEHANKFGSTALIIACSKSLESLALELIKTGQSKPVQINIKGATALIWACSEGLESVALALIQTGQSKPEQVNKDGNTALIWACSSSLENVALALIQTGQSKPEHEDNDGDTALILAKEKDLKRVVDELNKLLTFIININEPGFNIVTQETIVISDYLYENADNIVFKVRNSYFLTDIESIKEQMENIANIKYECRKAGNTSEFMLDSNIIYNTEFFSLSSITGIQGVVKSNDMKKICAESSYTSRLYEIRETTKKLSAIVSKKFIEGSDGVGADHCQPGKETTVYEIMTAIPTCGPHKLSPDESKEESKEEEKELQETKEDPTLTIMYKTKPYSVDILSGITIGTLKTNVLNMLVEKGIIADTNFNVKFIYKGKVITDNAVTLYSLNPPDGMIGETMQVMLTPITTGGTKRKTKRRRKRTLKRTLKRTRKNQSKRKNIRKVK
jgi:ankyrin repeat protein